VVFALDVFCITISMNLERSIRHAEAKRRNVLGGIRLITHQAHTAILNVAINLLTATQLLIPLC
jgi:hypothetical protein